jgi:16S rRNA (cytosine967-C5)-methyltransferase
LFKAQRVAAQAVRQVLSGRNLNLALEELRPRHFTPQQRAIAQDLSFGTLRWLTRLEALLAQLLEKPLTDENVHDLLLVALYQLEYSQNAPHAVVDHAVKAAAQLKKPWAKGLVNAVLRNFLRRREALLAKLPADFTTQQSWPAWWVSTLKNQYPQDWERILTTGNTHPPMTLRVNRRKSSAQDYLRLLAEAGIGAIKLGETGLLLEKPCPVDKLPGFFDGLVSVQDYGAQQAAPLLDVQDGMRVLDACSAPGGKTAHLLELADIALQALDSDAARLQKVQDNLQRLHLQAALKAADAAKPEQWWDGRPFDRILADVPCTASGIARRHPDIKWLRRESDIAGFQQQQENILRGLWSTLAKGGKLLYATCSVFAEENQEQIQQFLEATTDARVVPGVQNQLLPCEQHDGFFYALLEKI